MPKVFCDIVKCAYNVNCECNARIIQIMPNHVMNSKNVDYTEIIECKTYEKE